MGSGGRQKTKTNKQKDQLRINCPMCMEDVVPQCFFAVESIPLIVQVSILRHGILSKAELTVPFDLWGPSREAARGHKGAH